ncbi:MAG: benzoate-CoA ligase family protein, partial [Myxococcales bacterium]|nr:benzoate-CoA ligase family protein [Myxococcales bacterium]
MPSPTHNLAVVLCQGALDRSLGDKVALREGERAWTYAQLADHVARVSTALRTLRIGRGERVAVLTRDTLEGAAAILGVIHAGSVAVPLSELARAHDVALYLAHAGAVAAIVDGELASVIDEARGDVPALREVLVVRQGASADTASGARDFNAVVAGAAPGAPAAVELGDVCMLLYSAGTPSDDLRGVAHSHATPMAAWRSFGQGLCAMGEGDRVFSLTRFATAYGLGCGLLFPLAAGAESILLPAQAHSDAVFEAVTRHQPTVMFATPSIYGQLARDARPDARPLAALRLTVAGGEGMPDKLLPRIRDALGCPVTVGYGLTELLQMVLASDGALGSTCGLPLRGIDARVVDDDGAPVGADEIGTLELRSPSMFVDYWGGDPAEQAFRDGWFTTRDRFLVDRDGMFHHCGRVDDLFKVGGKWVSPVEVERVLGGHEAVWECAVIGVEDEDGLSKPLAFVVANVGHTADETLAAALRDYVKQELAPYKYPRWFEFVDHLPRGPGGKLLRYKLRPPRRPRRAETAAPPMGEPDA